ncbi:MAG TPA: pirin family protein [Geobacterales bacterium]|nr:pirin family protein [Geobacterales bacterium]
MATVRKIRRVWRSRPTIEGAGVHLKRAFGNAEVPQFDPFLLLDDFRSLTPAHYLAGFPWHPHRGIETITYMLQGSVEHGDSMGNRGTISVGDVQWMTAGSGIIHQEMPKGDDEGRMGGFQLWANLPAAQKMMDPRYRDVTAAQIPQVTLAGGTTARLIAGSLQGVTGPVRDIVMEPAYFDVTIPPQGRFTHRLPLGHTCFAYVIAGEGYFDDERNPFSHEVMGDNYFDMERQCRCDNTTLVLYAPGDELQITAEDAGVRFLLVSGRPIGEPVAWYGPIVMNTQQELETAMAEFRQGTFIKHG